MPTLRVVEVDEGSLDAFHSAGEAIHAGLPPGTAPTREAIDRNLGRAAFRGAQRAFVASDSGAPVGRIVARLSPSLRDGSGRPYGMLGFFECRDDRATADALFQSGTRWLATRGVGRIVGPMDGDTWHRYRVNVGPFERPPFPLEPWNPPYYRALWEGARFRVVETYSSKWISDVAALLPGLEPGLERSVSRGITVRPLRTERLADELAIVHEISSAIFADAFLYSPIARDEFLALYSGVERFLDPRLVLFAVDPEGREIGFVFGIADPRLPAVHYKTIGVLAEWRRAAAAAALSHHVYSNAIAIGRPQGNHALMRDDNRSQALDQQLGDVFRRYFLYEWPSPSST
jgi:hypothetical protein